MNKILRFILNSKWLDEMREQAKGNKKERTRPDKNTRDNLKLLGRWKPRKRKGSK